jgi:hypothetical protein
MLHEFAVDPDCMPTVDSLRRIADQCAYHLGRFISDFPRRRWVLLVRQRVNPQGFQEQQQLTEVLAAMQRRGGLIDMGRNYRNEWTWITNALNQHLTRPFHAIISGDNGEPVEHRISFARLGLDPSRWDVEAQVRIPRDAKSLVNCIMPLIGKSEEILFVDPHFWPDTTRYQSAIRVYLTAAHADGRTYKRLELHAKVNVRGGAADNIRRDWIALFEESCRKYLPRNVPKGVTLIVV